MDSTPKSNTLTFLVTDIEDSTRLWQAVPDAMQAALARHDTILRSGIEAHGGQVFKTAGDAFYATFALPARGLEAVLALQGALHAEIWPSETPIRVRMALNTDVAQARAGDYFGPALNVVARILSVTRGGQTLMSGSTATAVADVHVGVAELESHGFYRLKGIDEPVEVFEFDVRSRTAFAPPHDTTHAYRVVRAGELWQPVRSIRHNLPAERDAFVGRATELQAIAQRFDAGARLVTVLGPAGTGKTRFMCRYGRIWLGDWPGGVYFCDLSEARSLEGVLFAVATALDVRLGSDDPVMQLGHAIAGRERCLVILDNFEQITEHAPATVGRWLERATEAAFAVTSREQLHIAGEEVFPIEPLPLAQDALDLFAARARAQRPDFVLNDDNRPAVAEVVRLLDGLPLAIELAAARVRVFSPAQLVERMRDRFRLLAGARGAATRQATLRAAIDWSWDLLAPWEQGAFAQCSVFEGGFTMEAAEAVLDLVRWPQAPPIMDAVQALVDKSLLRAWVPAEQRRYDVDEPYFGMYLSIHEYAAEKLDSGEPGATHVVQKRHGEHFAGFGSDEALDTLGRHGGVRRRRALALELDNLLAACRRALAQGDAATAVATYRAAWEALELQGPFSVAASLGAQVLALESIAPSLRAAAILTQARVLWRTGRLPESEKLLEQALALAREAGDRRRESVVVGALGVAIGDVGRVNEARAHYETAIRIHREVGNRRQEGGVLGNLSCLCFVQGKLDEGRKFAEAALAIHREVGGRLAEASVLANLGIFYEQKGKADEARWHYEAAIAIEREIGNRAGEGNALGNLALLCLNQNLLDEARGHCEAAIAIARDTGDRWRLGVNLGNLAGVYFEERKYDKARSLWSDALAIHREVGNRRAEGAVLSGLAELLVMQGLADEAERVIAEGESLLRDVGDTLTLAILVCDRGQNEIARGRREQALAALDEAEALRVESGAGPDSPLDRKVNRLREVLATPIA